MAALLIFWVFTTSPGHVGTTKPLAFLSMEACLKSGPKMVETLPKREFHAGPWQWTCVAIEKRGWEAT